MLLADNFRKTSRQFPQDKPAISARQTGNLRKIVHFPDSLILDIFMSLRMHTAFVVTKRNGNADGRILYFIEQIAHAVV